MESWCFKGPASPLVVVCSTSTLLHTAVLSLIDVVGLWPGSPWAGLRFWPLIWWLQPCCWPPCVGVCFWLLETYPGLAACSARSALLTSSSFSVWTNCSVCSNERTRKTREAERIERMRPRVNGGESLFLLPARGAWKELLFDGSGHLQRRRNNKKKRKPPPAP